MLLALSPPILAGMAFWPEVRGHPGFASAALATYFLVLGLMLGVLRFASQVSGAVSDRWVPRVADAVDQAVSAVVLDYRNKYCERLSRSVRDIELLGVVTQGEYTLRLQQVYIEVSLRPQPLHTTHWEPFVGALAGPGERRPLTSFLDGGEPDVFVVVGGPGSGKTTLLRHTALDLCWQGSRTCPLPVLLCLRDHVGAIVREPGCTLGIVAASVAWMAGKIPAAWLEGHLDRGRCVVMLDGLDEVATEEDRRTVVSWVQRQIDRYPNNDFVITSRPHGYLTNPLSNANILQVRRFTGEQISRFVRNWYCTIECRDSGDDGDRVRARARRKADNLLHRLRTLPALSDLAANPLLLTMIANVHRYRGELPGSRAELFGEMCDLLLHRRQKDKGLFAVRAVELGGEQKERVARALALHMMVEQIRDVPAGQAREAIRPALERVSANVTAYEFLAEVERAGLLVEREAGVYAFAHLTLQEYLAAVEISESRRTDLLIQNVDNQWWRETTLLWAAAAGVGAGGGGGARAGARARADASPVVRACLEAGSVRSLALAFDCADEAREIHPAIREELDVLLDSPQHLGEPRRRVITAVKVARSLRDVMWLGDHTAVCVQPVSTDIYALFVEDEKIRGYHCPPDTEIASRSGESKVAVGMWASDAARFVTWVNSLFEDGTAYRLPTRDELADAEMSLVADLACHTVWMQGETRPRLYCPAGPNNPYQPAENQPDGFLILDRHRKFLLVFLLLFLNRDRRCGLTRVLDVARVLDLACELSHTDVGEFGRDRYLNLYLDLARDLDRTLAPLPDLGRADALYRDLVCDLYRDLYRDLDFKIDLYCDLDQELHQGLASDLASDPDLACDLARHLGNGDNDADGGGDDDDGGGDDGGERERGAGGSVCQQASRIRGLVFAYAVLVACWTRQHTKLRGGHALADFGEFLTRIAGGPSRECHILPEEVAESLAEINARREPCRDAENPALCDLVRRITDDVHTLVTPILARRAVYDADIVGCARIGLVAVAAYANQTPGAEGMRPLLNKAIHGLTVLQQRNEGGIDPNEMIILVRA